MPLYTYKARKSPTETIDGELQARSKDEAVTKLNNMGMAPISVTQKYGMAASPAESAISEPHLVRVRTRDVDTFTRQLAHLIRASVPVLAALSQISQQTENKTLKNVVSDIEKRIKDGKTLSEAMGRFPRIFDGLYLGMVKAGESSGSLDEVLMRLVEHRDKEDEVRRNIQSALAYPALIIVVGTATVFVMLTFFMPKLIRLFDQMQQKLPLPTRILMGTTEFMSNNWYWFLAVVLFLIALFARSSRGSKKKFLIDMIKLHLPFVKKFVRISEIARFARTLGLLIKNGIPVYESLELATDTLENDAFREQLHQAGKKIVNQGATLSDSLGKIDGFPIFAVNMMSVGEAGGRLDESLAEIANVYEREVEQALKIMTSLLEPLLILVVGAIVGFIVFAMLLPIFNIGA